MLLVPNKIFFTKGVGTHIHHLQSFEMALRDADVEKQNLVTVSSIFPPHCKIVSRDEGIALLNPGSIAFCVMARIDTNEKGRLIGASIGLAQPTDSVRHGYLSEHHAYGEDETKISTFAEDLAVSMLGTTLGVDLDPSKSFDDRKRQYLMSGKIINTTHITQTAIGEKDGLWTTVVALAVFVFDMK